MRNMDVRELGRRLVSLLFVCFLNGVSAGAAEPSPELRIRKFLPEPPVCRAGRPVSLNATVENAGKRSATVQVDLLVPQGIRIAGADFTSPVLLPAGAVRDLRWTVEAEAAGAAELRLRLAATGFAPGTASLRIVFLPPVEVRKLPYIPEPEPAKTQVLIGAHHCPLWEADKPDMWANVLKHPERTPALGFYCQENPEVSDWETKWAVEHGISFFIYCWYRSSQGGAVTTRFSSAIHDALFKSRFVNRIKFTIMWENQSRGRAGVADEADLMKNLLPFWIENYFRHPSYLRVDGRPVLFIYRPEFLVQDLGGEANVRAAFDKMRVACRDAGLGGLHLLGEYRGTDARHLNLLKRLGLDCSFAYCWHVPNNPTPEQAIRAQMEYIEKTQQLNILPQVVTVSQAWSGWRDEGTIWKIPPADYETLLRKAKGFIAGLPAEQLGSRMLLLDNWNEWGEGHYIAPYREYGFGYLDAVRKVFAPSSGPHLDLIPEDIGLGPYDGPMRAQLDAREERRRLCEAYATKGAAPQPGLVGWWAFDEDKNAPVALDYSGNRMGADVCAATRAPGIDASALVCTGGCASVPPNPALCVTSALTVACWIKTDIVGQKNQWFVNRVLPGGTDSGFRLGVLDDHPCFEIPVTSFSHHLRADVPLTTNRWTHVAGTFDGQTMRIYVDGAERGAMARPGPIKASRFPLCLGNYERGHAAHFTGLLDEVKIYDRALPPAEIRREAEAYANRP